MLWGAAEPHDAGVPASSECQAISHPTDLGVKARCRSTDWASLGLQLSPNRSISRNVTTLGALGTVTREQGGLAANLYSGCSSA